MYIKCLFFLTKLKHCHPEPIYFFHLWDRLPKHYTHLVWPFCQIWIQPNFEIRKKWMVRSRRTSPEGIKLTRTVLGPKLGAHGFGAQRHLKEKAIRHSCRFELCKRAPNIGDWGLWWRSGLSRSSPLTLLFRSSSWLPYRQECSVLFSSCNPKVDFLCLLHRGVCLCGGYDEYPAI